MREKRARDARERGEESDDFDLRVEKALAVGEMRVCDTLGDIIEGQRKGDWRGPEAQLRLIHRIVDPIDEQRIAESKASAKALEHANSPEGQQIVRGIVSELLGKRGGQATAPGAD
jgi:hypothetical protein